MLITSISFESDLASEDGEYWVHFKSDIMTGEALFFPSKYFWEDPMPLYVEVDQREIQGFKILSSAVEHDYQVDALPHRGDYKVTGQVSFFVINEDDSGHSIGVCTDSYTCSIGSFAFCLSSEEIGQLEIEKGDWVEFILIGLSLWDTGT
jgi:hypothetical protein